MGRGRMVLAAIAFVALAQPGTVAFAQDGGGPHSPLPDWSGVWTKEGAEPTISGFTRQPEGSATDRTSVYPLVNPEGPWNETGRARLLAMFAALGDRKGEGWGYPMMMAGSAPFEFVITPKQVLIMNPYRDFRRVFTDGRDLPPEDERWPTTWGSSVGRWEGETLVIETVSVRDPLAYFFLVPTFSENAVYVERYTRKDPDRIEGSITITDPETLSAPWTIPLAFTRSKGLSEISFDAFSNDRSELENGVFSILPEGEKAD